MIRRNFDKITGKLKDLKARATKGLDAKEQESNNEENKETKIPNSKAYLIGEELKCIREVLVNGHLHGDGKYTRLCQEFIEKELGAKKCLLTTSGTKALEMSYVLAGVRPGDEVIMPSFGFVSSASSLMVHGAVPVFVDVKETDMNIDPKKIEAAITDKTKAILVVHYAGAACDMDAIMKIAEQRGILVIEDAAQAIGSKYNGKYLGTIGDLGCYSFHGTKNIVCGEGGAININNENLIDRAEIVWEKGTNRKKFLNGQVDKYTWVDIGSSYLPSEILAAVLYPQLLNFKSINQKREVVAKRYHKMLAAVEKSGSIRLPVYEKGSENNNHIYHLFFENDSVRDYVMKGMNSDGISAYFHFVPLHTSPMGEKLGYKEGDFPVTEIGAKTLLRIPMYSEISEAEQQRVVNSLQKHLSANSNNLFE